MSTQFYLKYQRENARGIFAEFDSVAYSTQQGQPLLSFDYQGLEVFCPFILEQKLLRKYLGDTTEENIEYIQLFQRLSSLSNQIYTSISMMMEKALQMKQESLIVDYNRQEDEAGFSALEEALDNFCKRYEGKRFGELSDEERLAGIANIEDLDEKIG